MPVVLRGLLMATAMLPVQQAYAGQSVALSHATVSLHGGWQEDDGTRIAGLEIDLAKGWKTYWRSPGTAGLPPLFDWSRSRNVAAVAVEFPAPRVFDTFGVKTVGYLDDIVLPLRVTPIDPASPVHLDGEIAFGLCEDICIPASVQVSAAWQPGLEEEATLVRVHRARVPEAATAGGIAESACAVRGAGRDRHFAARLVFDERPQQDPIMLIEGPQHVWFATPSLEWDDDVLHAEAGVEVYGEGAWIARDSLQLTLLWPDRALAVERCSAL